MPASSINLDTARKNLQAFRFKHLFVEDLGWSDYTGTKREVTVKDGTFTVAPVAEMSGVVVLEIHDGSGEVPESKTRKQIHTAIGKDHHENLLIFTDRKGKAVSSSVWSWAKKDGTKRIPKEIYFLQGQHGDLLLSKLAGIVVDITELDEEGQLPVIDVTRRLEASFDIEKVTKRFFNDFQTLHIEFVNLIEGISDPADRKWYASVLLNRLMFIYFLQAKGFMLGNRTYLADKIAESKKRGKDRFYSEFLQVLFFEGFAVPTTKRGKKAEKLLGDIPYLNGSLFLHHKLELPEDQGGYDGKIKIPDAAFDAILALFNSYNWALDDTPGGDDRTINPDVLGHIFEKYINQKEFGAYYTPVEITRYLCEQTIDALVLRRLNERLDRKKYKSLNDALVAHDREAVRALLLPGGILPGLTILDPAQGSGAFLIAALRRLFEIYAALVGKIEYLHDQELTAHKNKLGTDDKGRPRHVEYGIKKAIITDNIYGVDIMPEAVEIAKVRLYLALVSSVDRADQLEPLPNIDFNIMAGNSLIGLMKVDPEKPTLFGRIGQKDYTRWLKEKNELIDQVRHLDPREHDIEFIRNDVREKMNTLRKKLDAILLTEFDDLAIQFDQAEPGKKRGTKRQLTVDDMTALNPFHWGFEFDQIMQRTKPGTDKDGKPIKVPDGGFDLIIANPPWEVLQAEEKEFLGNLILGPLGEDARVKMILKKHGIETVNKNVIDIKAWSALRDDLLKLPDVEKRWLDHCSTFPHQVQWFKDAPQYPNQRSIVDGKNVTRKINLYAVFTEQVANLLRDGGLCGIVLPSGIYTDLGTKQLREMLFSQTRITGFFGFENRRKIFDNVDSRFKFVVLTFEKGGKTKEFPAAFMRLDPKELEGWPDERLEWTASVDVKTLRRSSPDSLSFIEFRCAYDMSILNKCSSAPLLSEPVKDRWGASFSQELNMTQDNKLFEQEPAKGRLPLYEGRMIHHFDHRYDGPRYWVDEAKGRKTLLGRTEDEGQLLDYQTYRWAFRDVARNTDERTMICTLIPPAFHGHKLPSLRVYDREGRSLITAKEQLYFTSLMSSFALDYLLRLRVTMTVAFYLLNQLPVPRLTEGDPWFSDIVERSAKLICTTPEFDDLAKEVGLGCHKNGVTDPTERARLRAELDGIVAHLYGLTEEEFAYILTTFPLVNQKVKDDALAAFKALAPKPGDAEIQHLIRAGESATVEFKSTARWNIKAGKQDPVMEQVIVKTVAAFLNSAGGTLLIGVADDGTVLGLDDDLKTLGKKQDLDGFELFLGNLFFADGKGYGKDIAPSVAITFHKVDGKDVCRIVAKQAPRLVYVKENNDDALYIRTGNATRKLSTSEAIEYAKGRKG